MATARRPGINRGTVSGWRNRDFVYDPPMGSKNPLSAAFSPAREALCVLYRRRTRFSLDDRFHIDIADVGTGEGRPQFFVAIDNSCQFVHAEVHRRKSAAVAAEFPRNPIAAVPCRVPTILIDNGVPDTNRERDRKYAAGIFAKICGENGIEHRLTKEYHPWMNGQLERISRTLKETAVKRHHCDPRERFLEHPGKFLGAYILPDVSGHCRAKHLLRKS